MLESSNEKISKIKERLVGAPLEAMMKSPMAGCSKSMNELLIDGLVELCRVKPSGLDAVTWLGEWLLANNPNKPNVISPDDE